MVGDLTSRRQESFRMVGFYADPSRLGRMYAGTG